MNRAQRRAAAKSQPRYIRGLTTEEKVAKLYRNGITGDDIRKARDEGYHEGFVDAGRETLRTIYANVVRGLGKRGWKRKSILQFMRGLDSDVLSSLASSEDIQTAFEETGIELDFAEPFDRVQEAGE